MATPGRDDDERRIAELLGRGFSGKQIAYQLGVPEPAVSRAAARAARRLGLRSRTELAARFAPRTAPAETGTLDELSEAEREVALLACAGESNEAIAARRRRSARTVANQLGAAFAKLGVHSRIELVVRVAGVAPTTS